MRERLLSELDALASADAAAIWAQRSLPAKNTLTADDAQLVEAGFGAKIAAFGDGEPPETPGAPMQSLERLPQEVVATPSEMRTETPSVTPGTVAVTRRRPLAAKTIRLRDKEHRRFVSRQPCVVCGRTPCDPHHLKFAQPRALGRKVSDEFTVPLCRTHHRQLHRRGRESTFWTEHNIEPLALAARLWSQTRGALLESETKEVRSIGELPAGEPVPGPAT